MPIQIIGTKTEGQVQDMLNRDTVLWNGTPAEIETYIMNNAFTIPELRLFLSELTQLVLYSVREKGEWPPGQA